MENKSDIGITALMKAASGGDAAQVQALLDGGADVNAEDMYGNTALIYGARGGYAGIVKALLDRGADASAKNHAALTLASSRGYEQVLELLKNALDRAQQTGTRPPTEGAGAKSALLRAAQDGDIRQVNALLAENADVEAKNSDGLAPLMIATIGGHNEIVRALLNKGADVDAKDNKGRTALWFAVSMGDTERMKILLSTGADPNSTDNEGKTLLTRAASERNVSSLRVLLTHGAHVNAGDRNGETALTIAECSGYTDIIKLIKQPGVPREAAQATPPQSAHPALGAETPANIFYEDELSRLKEEMEEFISPAKTATGQVTSDTQALIPAQLPDAVEQFLAALEALRQNMRAPQARSRSAVDSAHKIMLTLPEAAVLTNLSRRHLRQAISEGKLKAQIIGRGWRVKRTDLDAYVREL